MPRGTDKSLPNVVASLGSHRRGRQVIAYDSKTPKDVPERIERALVYHIFGSRDTHPNFAVWEEDYLDFVLALVRHDQQLKNLFLLLKTRYLLLLGAPFADWIVRFFLFLVKWVKFNSSAAATKYSRWRNLTDGFDRNQVHFSSNFGLCVDGRMQRGPSISR